MTDPIPPSRFTSHIDCGSAWVVRRISYMTAHRNKRIHLILASVLMLGILLIVPWKVLIAPPFDVVVLQETGEPATGVLVKQEWFYQAPGSKSHTATTHTDPSGRATFPARFIRLLLIQRLLASLLNAYYVGHYGPGPHAQVWVHGADPHVWTFVNCSTRDHSTREVKLKRWETEIYP